MVEPCTPSQKHIEKIVIAPTSGAPPYGNLYGRTVAWKERRVVAVIQDIVLSKQLAKAIAYEVYDSAILWLENTKASRCKEVIKLRDFRNFHNFKCRNCCMRKWVA